MQSATASLRIGGPDLQEHQRIVDGRGLRHAVSATIAGPDGPRRAFGSGRGVWDRSSKAD